MITRRRTNRQDGRYPYEMPPPDHEHWFQWGPPERPSWTESAYVAFALAVGLLVLLISIFGVAPLIAMLG